MTEKEKLMLSIFVTVTLAGLFFMAIISLVVNRIS